MGFSWKSSIFFTTSVHIRQMHVETTESIALNGKASFGASGELCSMIMAFPGYLHLGFLEHHCENTPIQIYLKFYHQKWKFSDKKNSDIFHISAQNTDCGYSLEPPRRGGSNEYPQSMFLSSNKKNNVYPYKPQLCYIKVGFKGVKIILACSRGQLRLMWYFSCSFSSPLGTQRCINVDATS